jgi:modulator of FtsH protease HflC
MKKFYGLIIAAIVLTVLLFVTGTIYTVREDQQVILTQFGKPVGEPVSEAGLHFKMPFVQKVNILEKRVLAWDGQSSQMPTRDKTYIQVDTFARWEISDPLAYFPPRRHSGFGDAKRGRQERSHRSGPLYQGPGSQYRRLAGRRISRL